MTTTADYKEFVERETRKCYEAAVEQGFEGSFADFELTEEDVDWIFKAVAEDAGYEWWRTYWDTNGNECLEGSKGERSDRVWHYICDRSELGI